MTKPRRYLTRMGLFLLVVAVACGLLFPALRDAFMANAVLNGVILGALLIGIVHIFRTVAMLSPEVAWIEGFRRDQMAVSSDSAPRLLAPMAAMLREHSGGRLTLSTTAMRSLLDGIASRIDESREISRYMIGLLVFLGLLGTFWGLIETVKSISDVIGSLSAADGNVAAVFENLKSGLRGPLSGMGTAFSSSLFGLAGSLVLGFLALQAGQAQNRFYNDLEEWLSGLTRIGSAKIGGEGEHSVPAFIEALLEQTADNLEGLQRILSRGEDSRIEANRKIIELSDRLEALTETMRTGQSLMLRLAENQMELKPILARLSENRGGSEALTPQLRNIETYLSHMIEEMSTGRGEMIQEVRSEIRLLARTIAALAEE